MSTSDGPEARLAAFVQGRQGWVLKLAALNLAVLGAGILAAWLSTYVAFAALAAAWMFLAVRVSRFVVGSRSRDDEARRLARLAALEGETTLPDGVREAWALARQHRTAALALSAGAVAAIGLGALTRAIPSAGPWLFGFSALYVVVGIGWAWSRRRAWADARQRIDGWCSRGS